MKFHFKKMYWQNLWPLMWKQSPMQVWVPGYNYKKTFVELFTFHRHHFSGCRRQSVYMLPWVITLVAGQITGQHWCSHKHCQSAAVSVMSTSMFHHLMSSRGVKRRLKHNFSDSIWSFEPLGFTDGKQASFIAAHYTLCAFGVNVLKRGLDGLFFFARFW